MSVARCNSCAVRDRPVAALDTREPVGQVSFDGSGLAEPLSITLSREARSVRVSVDAAGNVRVGEPG